eukprot:TRINITY_DN19031_c0_g1_i2.p1 TRINITY_DN19031_c0_g1~~TRINITY_DN19031_c0_g1_i2.p1  ORF type:complete len:123 (-),score=24.11 TRINITY_DN19031_c0_g1_i2:6-374(-)
MCIRDRTDSQLLADWSSLFNVLSPSLGLLLHHYPGAVRELIDRSTQQSPHLAVQQVLIVRHQLRILHLLLLLPLFPLSSVSYTHLRAHETPEHLVCRLLLEKKKNNIITITNSVHTESIIHT